MTEREHQTIRVAFVGHKSLPANYGGVEVYAEEVGARLAELGHTVVSFTSGVQPGVSMHRGVECRRVGRVEGKHLGALSQALTATLAACRADVDIVHFMAMGPSIFAPIVRCLTSARVVVTVAGRDDKRRKWGPLARRLMRLSYFSCTRSSHCIIGVSQALTDELAPVTRGRCIHIANGVRVPDEPVVTLASIGVGDRPYLLYAGRLVPEKRAEVLLQAFAQIDSDHDLVIAGGAAGAEGYVEQLEALAEGDPRVRFLGHRNADEIDVLMRNTVAFVLPSELEGLPIALLEATGRGVPVVVSDLPCHREVLGSGGPGARIVPVGDVEALRAALVSCLHDPAAPTDARQRAAHITSTYRWDNVTEQVEAVYRQVLGRPQARCVREHDQTARA